MGNRVYRPYTHPLIQNNVKKPSTTSENGQSSFASELQSALVPKNERINYFQTRKTTIRTKRY